jgi:hypothetical protein
VRELFEVHARSSASASQSAFKKARDSREISEFAARSIGRAGLQVNPVSALHCQKTTLQRVNRPTSIDLVRIALDFDQIRWLI